MTKACLVVEGLNSTSVFLVAVTLDLLLTILTTIKAILGENLFADLILHTELRNLRKITSNFHQISLLRMQQAIVVLSLMVFDRVIQSASRDQMGLCHRLNYS